MKNKITWIILACAAAVIKVFSFFPEAVERYYSNGIFPVVSVVQRFMLGWLPLSAGDILYFVAGLYLVQRVFLFLKSVIKGQLTRRMLVQALKQVVFICLLVYVAFNALWGLNYNRLPMERQMALPEPVYSTSNLRVIVTRLISRLNQYDSSAQVYRSGVLKKKTLFGEAAAAYAHTASQYPALRYRVPSVKPSIYSYAGNYLGFTGYYNPFTGEAQSNTTVPAFVQPFTTCHEIGHQLGYAKENEANFAGFLAARSSRQAAFQYSAYFEMYAYALRELYGRDSTGAQSLHRKLNLQVRVDLVRVRQFYHRYDSPLGPVISRLYARFLRANEQPEGLRSYNEVVAMLLAFYKKNGTI